MFSNELTAALPIKYGRKKDFETHDGIDDGMEEHMHRDYEEDTLGTGWTHDIGKRTVNYIYGSGL